MTMSKPEYTFSFEPSLSTSVKVPVIKFSGREYWLGSKYDPKKEAQKIVDSIEYSSLFIVLGFGDGFLSDLLAKKHTGSSIMVVDFFDEMEDWIRDSASIRSLSSKFVDFQICPNGGSLESLVARHYSPLFFSSVRIIASPALSNYQRLLVYDPLKVAMQTIERLSNDFVTQSVFGKIWHRNIVHNLRYLARSPRSGQEYKSLELGLKDKDCLILGAGPGLEVYKQQIIALQKKGHKIACADASLNWVIANLGTYPDIVLSIDPQDYTLFHTGFVDTKHCFTTYLSDLGAHRQLFAKHSALPVNCGHPLAFFLTEGQGLPELKDNGANVGHALCSLLLQIGVKSATVFGLDFAYFKAMPYSKNTEWFASAYQAQDRKTPIEGKIMAIKADWSSQKDEIATFFSFSNQRFVNYYNAFKDRFEISKLSYMACFTERSFPGQSNNVAYKGSKGFYVSDTINIDFSDLTSRFMQLSEFLEANRTFSPLSLLKSKSNYSRNVLSAHLPLITHFFSRAIRAGFNPSDSITIAGEQAFSYSKRLLDLAKN